MSKKKLWQRFETKARTNSIHSPFKNSIVASKGFYFHFKHGKCREYSFLFFTNFKDKKCRPIQIKIPLKSMSGRV